MDDRYDLPHEDDGQQLYEESPLDKASEMGGSAIDFAKDHWQQIVGGIIILAVVLFTYDFFIGGFRNVTFEIMDAEGKPITEAAIKVLNDSGQEIKRANSGEVVGLKSGTYRVDVQSDGYRAIRAKTVTITESGPVELVLEIDKDLLLTGTFPETFATGEKKPLTLKIISGEAASTQIDLVLEGDAKNAMTLEYVKPLTISPGENEITVNLNVKDPAAKGAIGEGKSGSIRIAGFFSNTATIEGTYSLMQFSAKNVKFTVGSASEKLEYGNVKPGDHIEKPFKVTNSNEVEMGNLKGSVTVTEAEFGDTTEMIKWFKFSPDDTMTVAPKSDESINLIVEIPKSFQFPQGEDTIAINGVITASTTYFTKDIDFRMIVNRPKAAIVVTGLQDIITIKKVNGAYPTTADFINVKNNGEVALTDFDVRVQCSSAGSSWLTVGAGALEYSFDFLDKGTSKSVPFGITIPDATPDATVANCQLGVFYRDAAGNRPSTELQTIIKASNPA